jgi:hypothetical protein
MLATIDVNRCAPTFYVKADGRDCVGARDRMGGWGLVRELKIRGGSSGWNWADASRSTAARVSGESGRVTGAGTARAGSRASRAGSTAAARCAA